MKTSLGVYLSCSVLPLSSGHLWDVQVQLNVQKAAAMLDCILVRSNVKVSRCLDWNSFGQRVVEGWSRGRQDWV